MQDNAGKLLNIRRRRNVGVAPTTVHVGFLGRIPHIRLGRCIRFKWRNCLIILTIMHCSCGKPPKCPHRKPRRKNRSRKCINNNKFLEDLLAQVKDILDINQ